MSRLRGSQELPTKSREGQRSSRRLGAFSSFHGDPTPYPIVWFCRHHSVRDARAHHDPDNQALRGAQHLTQGSPPATPGGGGVPGAGRPHPELRAGVLVRGGYGPGRPGGSAAGAAVAVSRPKAAQGSTPKRKGLVTRVAEGPEGPTPVLC